MKKTYHSRGAALIAQERIEQVVKHGFDEKHDKDYGKGQLKDAGISAFFAAKMSQLFKGSMDFGIAEAFYHNYWPWKGSFSLSFFNKIGQKDEIGKLTVAGAFAAAEIDRLLPEETPKQKEERETLEKYQVAEAFKSLLRDDEEYAANFRDRITVCMAQAIQELKSTGESADDWFHFVGKAGAEKFINIFTDGPVEPTKKEENGTSTGI